MSLSKVRDINHLKDPLKQYQCKFYIRKPFLVKQINKLVSGGNIVDKEDFELRATSWTYPGTVIRTTDTVIFNHYRRRPTIQDKSGTWHVSVVEDMHASVLQSIWDWCDNIMNPATGLYGMSEFYVGAAAVHILGPDMKSNKTIYLRGFYPIKISETRIDPSSSNAVTIEIDFNYDWYTEQNWLGGSDYEGIFL